MNQPITTLEPVEEYLREMQAMTYAELVSRMHGLQAEALALKACGPSGDSPTVTSAAPQQPVPAVEWRLEMNPDGVRFTRYAYGRPDELYPTVPPWKAAIYAAAITQGFEPPRVLVHQDKPVQRTQPGTGAAPAPLPADKSAQKS